MTAICTIGYESSDLEDFVATLKMSDVEVLLDVRELPASRRKGFSKNKLAARLEEAGIEYVHLKGLGDPKAGREAARAGRMNEFRRVFNAHKKTPEYKAGLEVASNKALSQKVCLMCYERNHNDCHRTIVANDLSDILNLSIKHLGVPEGLARDASKGRTRSGSSLGQGAAACR